MADCRYESIELVYTTTWGRNDGFTKRLPAYSRRAIEKIRIANPDMGASSEILIQAKNHNLKIVEIPITVRYDIENTSSKNPWRHGFGVLGWLIRVTSEKRPLLFFEKDFENIISDEELYV